MSGNVYPTPTLQWGALLQDPTTSMQAATKEYVDGKIGGVPEAPTDGQTYGRNGGTTSWVPVPAAGAQVSSFNTRTGAVTLTLPDITGAGGAPNANPSFTGTTTATNLQVSGTVGGAGFTNLLSPYALSASTLPVSGGTMTGPLMLTATGGNTSRSVQDQFGDIIDVKDFGAKGDGVTVDTAAFNAAIATGKTVLVTPGTYIIGPITISQSMIGMGMGASILRAAPGGNPTSDVLITQNAAVGATICDLTINGANLCLYGVGLGSAPQQTGLRFARLEVCNIGTTSSTASPLPGGIFWYATTVASKQGIVVSECYIHDVYGDGIHADGTGNIISHNTLINIGSAGISYDLAVDGVISSNTINNTGTLPVIAADGITGYGQNNLRMLLIGNTIDTGQNHGIHIGGNNNQIVGNKIYNVQAYGIILQSAPNASPTPSVNGLIANNEVDTAAGGGVRCGWFSRVTVIGNTVSNLPSTAGPALVFLISNDCVCSNNIVYNIGNDGVLGNTALNLIVSGNRISTVTGMGVHDAGGSTGMRVSDNIITGESTVSNWDRVLASQGSGVVSVTSGTLSLTNATANFEIFGAGAGVPTYTTRSAGTKIVLSPTISPTAADHAIGVSGNQQWYSTPNNNVANTFNWYGGTTQIAYLDGTGNFYAATNVWCPGGFTVTASGTYPFQLVLASGNQQLQFQGPNYAITCTGATGYINFLVASSTPVMTVSPAGLNVTTGAYQVAGTKVVGAQITGYGTPTGGVKTASFPGASATLAQTSAQLAQLILDLKTHGLLGA